MQTPANSRAMRKLLGTLLPCNGNTLSHGEVSATPPHGNPRTKQTRPSSQSAYLVAFSSLQLTCIGIGTHHSAGEAKVRLN